MAQVVRAALLQTAWTGDKESMIRVHEDKVREAASAGAQVMCFQELFYGPYFCQVQDEVYFEYAESVPGPTVERFQQLARDSRMVLILPVYEREQEGVLYNTAAVIDADGTLPRQVPQDPHPAGEGVLGEVLLPARQPRVPGVRHRGRSHRRLHLLRPPLPRGLASARPRGCADRVQPVGDEPRPVDVPLEPRAARVRGRERVLRGRDQPRRGRASRRQRLLRVDATSSIPAASWSARPRATRSRSSSSATSTSTSSPRSAASGSSTETAVPTCTGR